MKNTKQNLAEVTNPLLNWLKSRSMSTVWMEHIDGNFTMNWVVGERMNRKVESLKNDEGQQVELSADEVRNFMDECIDNRIFPIVNLTEINRHHFETNFDHFRVVNSSGYIYLKDNDQILKVFFLNADDELFSSARFSKDQKYMSLYMDFRHNGHEHQLEYVFDLDLEEAVPNQQLGLFRAISTPRMEKYNLTDPTPTIKQTMQAIADELGENYSALAREVWQ